jgi:hypothetical protein
MTLAVVVMTGGKLFMPAIFQPFLTTKKDADFFCATSPAVYST